jgi:PhnB protein
MEHTMQLNPYLNFNGQCEEAFKFYEQCLGGKIEAMMTHEGTPMAEHVPAEWRSKILHARMSIGDTVVMGSDAPPDRYDAPHGFYVSLNIEKPEDADRIFHALSENGKVEMPIDKTFWAERFGMTVDRFGTPWMVNCDKSE